MKLIAEKDEKDEKDAQTIKIIGELKKALLFHIVAVSAMKQLE